MAHKTRIDGTVYEVTGGRIRDGGTGYALAKGRAADGGTVYELLFAEMFCLEVNSSGYNAYELVYTEGGVEKTLFLDGESTEYIYVDTESYLDIQYLYGQGYTPGFYDRQGKELEAESVQFDTWRIAASDCMLPGGEGYLLITA